MSRLIRAVTALRKHPQDVAEFFGFVLVAAGVALVYLPAGIITAGLVLVLAGNVSRS